MTEMPPTIGDREITRDERLWATLAHLGGLLIFAAPLQILAPLVIWLIKKEESPFIDAHGKEALNFQISVFIYTLIASITLFFCIGFVLVPAIIIADLVYVIIAATKANQGSTFQYPLTIRFIK